MPQFTVVYDACVLYPAALRDFLMHLAITNLFRARWTDRIHEEWIRNVLRDRPDHTAQQLARTRQLMDENVLDCLVTGYESLIPSLSLPDLNDRHVLAAAIRCGANSIVTFNTKDFPTRSLEPFGIEAFHPEEFVLSQLDRAPSVVCSAAKRQRANLRNPPKNVDEYLDCLSQQGLMLTSNELRKYRDLI
ncbi:MAG: PIN domain-containing protein [Pirellula sp.]